MQGRGGGGAKDDVHSLQNANEILSNGTVLFSSFGWVGLLGCLSWLKKLRIEKKDMLQQKVKSLIEDGWKIKEMIKRIILGRGGVTDSHSRVLDGRREQNWTSGQTTIFTLLCLKICI